MPRVARCLALALLLVAGRAAFPDDEGKVLHYSESRYVTLDPSQISGSRNDERMVLAVLECLTRLDPATGRAIPAAAEKWEASADGRTWTFHLRAGGAWSDGSPVVSQDFVYAWRRAVQPETVEARSPWRFLFRPIEGVATMADADFARGVLSDVGKRLKDLAASHADGIPGDLIEAIRYETGIRAVASQLKDPTFQKFLRWGHDKFSAADAQKVLDVMKEERGRLKPPIYDTYEAFGTSGGVTTPDDKTLVVRTTAWVPYLPELVARAPFAPLSPKTVSVKPIGLDPPDNLWNGPYVLKARGPRPHGNQVISSVVRLERNPKYTGPAPAALDVVVCWTDEGPDEEIRRFLKKDRMQWMANPSFEKAKDIEKLPGYVARPAGSALFLRLRCDKEPFVKIEARKAYALSVDRAALAKLLWPGADVAERLVPPGVRGCPGGVEGPRPDVPAAKEALKATGWPADQFPWVEIFFAGLPGHSDVARAVAKNWAKTLGVDEAGQRYDEPENIAKSLREGVYQVYLSESAGDVDDPSSFLEMFHSSSPDGGLGWKDEIFDRLVDAARDLDAFLKAPQAVLAAAKGAGLAAMVEAAKGGAEKARGDLRLALWAEAERRLLDQYVVVPLLFPKRAEVLGEVKGLGSDAAWKNPSFVGSLRDATR